MKFGPVGMTDETESCETLEAHGLLEEGLLRLWAGPGGGRRSKPGAFGRCGPILTGLLTWSQIVLPGQA